MTRTIVLIAALLIGALLVLGCTVSQKSGAAPSIQSGGSTPAPNPSAQAGLDDMPPAPPSDDLETSAPSGPTGSVEAATAVPSGMDALPALPSSDGSLSGLAGTWKVYSSRLFYDVGGAGAMDSTTRTLELTADGRWNYGGSTGSWFRQPIQDADWKRWNVDSYGPKEKIVLDGWNGGFADGPIEANPAQPDGADFFWVIYHVEPPLVQNSGQVQTKFGH